MKVGTRWSSEPKNSTVYNKYGIRRTCQPGDFARLEMRSDVGRSVCAQTEADDVRVVDTDLAAQLVHHVQELCRAVRDGVHIVRCLPVAWLFRQQTPVHGYYVVLSALEVCCTHTVSNFVILLYYGLFNKTNIAA